METLKSLLNQRDCQDVVIAKYNLQIERCNINIREMEMKIENIKRTMQGNIDARQRAAEKLADAQKLRDELSSKIENFNS